MKALTIRQPWASLIIARAKPYEFRGWEPPRALIGQRIVIHAAARRIDREEVEHLLHLFALRDVYDSIARAAAETCLIPERTIPVLKRALAGRLPMAAGIGTAALGWPEPGRRAAFWFGVSRADSSDAEMNLAWPMQTPRRWPEPIPMRGRLGFWDWPAPNASAGGGL